MPCGQGLVRVFLAQSALVLEFLQSPFLGGGRRVCMCGAHPADEFVRRKLGLVLSRS